MVLKFVSIEPGARATLNDAKVKSSERGWARGGELETRFDRVLSERNEAGSLPTGQFHANEFSRRC